MIQTTLKKILAGIPYNNTYIIPAGIGSGDGSGYGDGAGDDTPVTLMKILDSNGMQAALRALRFCDTDAEGDRVLRLFASDCAQRALERERDAGREPDPRSWAAVDVARRFAAGEATQEELDAAWAAAWAAAGEVAAAEVAAGKARKADWAARAAAQSATHAAEKDAREAAFEASGGTAAAAAWRELQDDEFELQREFLRELLDDTKMIATAKDRS